jgi:hypothetical protein
MDTGEFLVRAVHQMPRAAFGAVPAASCKKPDSDALTNTPAFNTFTKPIDLANHLVAGNSGPVDRKYTFDSRRVRMAHAASLDLDADLTGKGRLHWLSGKFKFAGRDCVNGEIGFLRVDHVVLLLIAFPLVRCSRRAKQVLVRSGIRPRS